MTFTIDSADAICVCGHWTEEHGLPDRPDGSASCYGCGVNDATGAQHDFELDPEASSPESIAARGGDPDCWPEYVKAYFIANYPEQVPELTGAEMSQTTQERFEEQLVAIIEPERFEQESMD